MSEETNNEEVFGCIYLDDVYCNHHETDPSYVKAFYNKEYDKYFYQAVHTCNNSERLLLGSKEGLILTLESKRQSFISSYPEIASAYDSMIKRVRKYKK